MDNIYTHHIDFSETNVEPQKAFDLLQALKGLYNGRLSVRRVIEISTPDKSVLAVIASLVASLDPGVALPRSTERSREPAVKVVDAPELPPPAVKARTKANGAKARGKPATKKALEPIQCQAPGCDVMFTPRNEKQITHTKSCYMRLYWKTYKKP